MTGSTQAPRTGSLSRSSGCIYLRGFKHTATGNKQHPLLIPEAPPAFEEGSEERAWFDSNTQCEDIMNNSSKSDFDRPSLRNQAKKSRPARTPCGLETKIVGQGDAYMARHVCPVCEEVIWKMSYGDWVQCKDMCVSRAEAGYGCADLSSPSSDMDGYEDWLTPKRK